MFQPEYPDNIPDSALDPGDIKQKTPDVKIVLNTAGLFDKQEALRDIVELLELGDAKAAHQAAETALAIPLWVPEFTSLTAK